MVNGPDDVYVERGGRIERAPDGLFEGEEAVLHLMGREIEVPGCTQSLRGGAREDWLLWYGHRMVSADGEVVGREGEIAAVLNFLQEPSAFPGALLLEGEPGIGKTTLWQRGLELASAFSYRVLSCSPSGSEARLSFAALGDMLEPVLGDILPALPRPQARALAVALLLEDADGPPPDQRAIALAFLGAIRALAEEGPVVIAVDDIQWLDDPSAFVLEFAHDRPDAAHRILGPIGERLEEGGVREPG